MSDADDDYEQENESDCQNSTQNGFNCNQSIGGDDDGFVGTNDQIMSAPKVLHSTSSQPSSPILEESLSSPPVYLQVKYKYFMAFTPKLLK